MNTVEGLDVSVYERISDWASVPPSKKFMATRATVGDYYRDPTFIDNWKQGKRAGRLRTAYHVVRPDKTPQNQILGDGKTYGFFSFMKLVDNDLGELPISADVEVLRPFKGAPDFPKQQQIDVTGECLHLIEREAGRKPLIYTAKWFTDQVMGTDNWPFGDYDHWLAGYPWDKVQPNLRQLPATATLSLVGKPKGLSDARIKFWQYTEKGLCGGIDGNVDLDVFLGTESELIAYSGVVVAPEWVTIALKAQTAEDVYNAIAEAMLQR